MVLADNVLPSDVVWKLADTVVNKHYTWYKKSILHNSHFQSVLRLCGHRSSSKVLY